MKKTEWVNGNKMLFESKHKTFNRQTNYISTGNVWSNTQHSGYIRAYNDTINPVGEKVEKGHLQDFDLDGFSNLPSNIRSWIKQNVMDNSVILYRFQYYIKSKRIDVGYILTDSNHKYIQTWICKNTQKYWSVIEEAKLYICE